QIFNFFLVKVIELDREIYPYEIRDIYRSLSRPQLFKVIITMVKGVFYDYLHKIYQVVWFREVDYLTIQRYKAEILHVISQKNYKLLFDSRYARKLVIIYQYSNHSWIYRNIQKYLIFFTLEFTYLNSYWCLASV